MYGAGAFLRMLLHFFIFFRLEFSGLPEYRIIDGDLSKIVHWSSFYHISAEFIRKIIASFLYELFNKDADAFAGSFNMTAGGIIPAFNQDCHAHYKIVVHFHDMLCFSFDFRLKLFVIGIDQPDVFLVFGIIRKGYDVTFLV